MADPPKARSGRSRWDLIRSGHLRLRSDLTLTRISLDAVRLLAHSADPKARGRVAYARAAEHYDEARRLLDKLNAELDAIERNREWKPPPMTWSQPPPWDRRSATDRRSGRDRRVLSLTATRLERRQGERRSEERRELPVG